MEKISPATIERPRVIEWLTRNATFPLRALIAPAGYGKTTALVRYLQTLKEPHAYVRAQPDDTPKNLVVRLASELGLGEVATFSDLRRRMLAIPSCTIAIDALDLASREAIFEAASFAIGSPQQVRTIVAGCRSETIDTPRVFSKGLAALMSPRILAFTIGDLSALCASLGVEASEADVRAVSVLSDGWPAVASEIVRAAASDGRSLHGAYELWLASSAHTLRRFVEAEVNRAPAKAQALFSSVIGGELLLDEDWQMLEAAGLFVTGDVGASRLLYPVGAIFTQSPRLGTGATQRLSISLFGEFDVSCGGNEVKWLRRRDADLVRMLAVRVGGTATRSELIERFWPETEKRAAQQSLRTSCSNIRKAIALVTGPHRVDRYFGCGTGITLDPNSVSLDGHRFLSHVHSGDDAFKKGQRDSAASHYRAAVRLRTGPPAIDAEDAMQVAFASRLEEAFAHARQRLEELETSTPGAADGRKRGSSDRGEVAPSTRAAS
ncbi:MAG TPA: AAA family ATPase [Candidatus Baltobacteraceae bacterium]|nr:AAA family ATPase [Candidatus Baltobacteraceae bacterium]